MTTHDADESTLPKLSKREKHWLHAHLSVNPGTYFHNNFSRIRSTKTIVEDLFDGGGNPSALRLFVDSWSAAYWLPKDELDWISASHQRQLVWLLNELKSVVSATSVDQQAPNYMIESLYPYIPEPATALPRQRHDIAIATIDAWPISLHRKQHILNVMRQTWERSRVPWRQTKWLDGKDENQLDWAVEYVTKSNLWQKRGITFTSLQPQDLKEKHTYVLSFLDHLYKLSEEFQELFITKMRKTWSQKKYRESEKAKKQVYFSLSDEARQHLRQLEKARKQSKNRIIEDLLSQAAQSRRPPG